METPTPISTISEVIHKRAEENARDALIDDATHAAANRFKASGIELTTEELYRLNDFLTKLLDDHPLYLVKRIATDDDALVIVLQPL